MEKALPKSVPSTVITTCWGSAPVLASIRRQIRMPRNDAGDASGETAFGRE